MSEWITTDNGNLPPLLPTATTAWTFGPSSVMKNRRQSRCRRGSYDSCRCRSSCRGSCRYRCRHRACWSHARFVIAPFITIATLARVQYLMNFSCRLISLVYSMVVVVVVTQKIAIKKLENTLLEWMTSPQSVRHNWSHQRCQPHLPWHTYVLIVTKES